MRSWFAQTKLLYPAISVWKLRANRRTKYLRASGIPLAAQLKQIGSIDLPLTRRSRWSIFWIANLCIGASAKGPDQGICGDAAVLG